MSTQPPQPFDFEVPFESGDVIKHLKSGGIYIFRGVGRMEASLEPMCADECQATGQLWFRSPAAMFDGRFMLVLRTPA